jgi:hypothetical protein
VSDLAKSVFEHIGIDINKISWTNLFQKSATTEGYGIEQDFGKHHAEDSVNSAAWLDRLIACELLTFDEVEWAPMIEIVMEG